MIDRPKRHTLVAQVASALRQGIETGEWVARLPSEQALAEALHVCRTTVRAGMLVLKKEGVIRVAKGRRAEIREPARAAGVRPGHGHRVVGVLAPRPPNPFDIGDYFDTFRLHLQEAGAQVDCHWGSRFYHRHPIRFLEELVRESKVDIWVLTWSNDEIQEWFSRRQIPVVVAGTCRDGLNLPALDADYRAVCRHAVGVALRLGHRRIAYLGMKNRALGNVASEKGFAEAFERVPDAVPSLIMADEALKNALAALQRAFRSPAPPTALIAGHAGLCGTALTYLTGNGLLVPGDVSLLCRDDSPMLDYFVPSIARYAIKSKSFGNRLAELVLRHFSENLAGQQHFVMPAFVPGQSMGAVSSGTAANRGRRRSA